MNIVALQDSVDAVITVQARNAVGDVFWAESDPRVRNTNSLNVIEALFR